MSTEIAVRSAQLLFSAVKSCQREGKGDPRRLSDLMQSGNKILRDAGFQRTEEVWNRS